MGDSRGKHQDLADPLRALTPNIDSSTVPLSLLANAVRMAEGESDHVVSR